MADNKLECPHCTKTYAHRQSLNRHLKKEHSTTSTGPQFNTVTTGATKILFLAIPTGKNIRDDTFTTIRCPLSLEQHRIDPDCNISSFGGHQGLKALKDSIGTSFVSNIGDNWYIHQQLATLLIAARKLRPSWKLEIQKWEWAIPLIRSGTLLNHLSNGDLDKQAFSSQRIFIFASSTSADWLGQATSRPSKSPAIDMSQTEFLDKVYPIIAGYENVRIYPSVAEQRYEMLKIADLRTLDRIARDLAKIRPEFSHRPRTCYGLGDCALSDLKDNDSHVLKRSNSCASSHVIVCPSGNRGQLRCILPSSPPTLSASDVGEPLWFHQEFVPKLSKFEFRVFITNNAGGPIVSHIIRTANAPKTKGDGSTRLGAIRANLDHFQWAADGAAGYEAQKKRDAKFEELREFALCWHRFLCAQPNAKQDYETLFTGVRVDIGVLDVDNGRFFISELTRWFDADFFAETTLPMPHLDLCESYAEALTNYIEHQSS